MYIFYIAIRHNNVLYNTAFKLNNNAHIEYGTACFDYDSEVDLCTRNAM